MTQSTPWGSIFSAGNVGGHVNDTRYEQTAMTTLRDGRIVLSWLEMDPSPTREIGIAVRAQILNADGTPAGSSFTVNEVTGGDFYQPDVVALANGGFAVVYDQQNGPAQVNLFAHIYGADGTSVKETLLAQNDRNAHFPSTIALADGGFVVTMKNHDGVNEGLGFVKVSSDGMSVDKSIYSPGMPIYEICTAVSQSGDYLTAYNDGSDVYHQKLAFDIRHANGAITKLHQVIPDAEVSTEIQVAALDGGAFVVVWNQSDNTNSFIKARIIGADGTQGPELNLNGYAYNFDVDKLPGGGFVLTFAGSGQTWIKTFDAAGSVVDDFAVTTGLCYDASVTVMNDGRYLVKWIQSTNNEIKAQIFDPRTSGETWHSASTTGEQHGGTHHSDNLTGSAGNDTLYGAAGDDVLTGGAGVDAIFGDAGADVIEGGGGADRLHGGAGWDVLSYEHSGSANGVTGVTATLLHPDWSTGNDAAGDVFDGFEAVLGSAYNDLLVGDNTGNVLDGAAGDDVLDGAGGADEMRGGEGFDRVTYWYNTPAGKGVTVDLSHNDGNAGAAAGDVLISIESVQGTDAADTLVGTVRANGEGVELLGEGGDDRLVGKGGVDTLSGGDGNDIVEGGAGADQLHGGAGWDVLSYEHSSSEGGIAGVIAMLLHPDWTAGNDASGDVFDGFEALLGSAYNDMLVGDNNVNVLDGGAGDDTLDGAGGADEMRGGEGFDRVIYWENTPAGQGVTIDLSDNSRNAGAAAGDVLTSIESVGGTDAADTLIGTVRADGGGVELFGEGGDDRLVGKAGNDSLAGGDGNDTLDGGAGGDRMKGGAGNDTYRIDSASDQVFEAADGGIDTAIVALDFRMDALANVEILKLADGTAATRATGGAGRDHLIGNTAFNILDGGAGADTLEGSAGSDVFMVDNVGDVVVEAAGGGTDSIQASVSYTLATDSEVEFLTALGAGGVALTGNAFANTLTGNAGSNALDAGAGSDKLLGMAGNDQLSGGAGNDILDGGFDLDFLSAGVGDDRLLGGGGNDTLWGDLGNDHLSGGDGRDILSGGKGRDQFLFDTAVASRRNANIDKITDFSVREGDKIVLENAIFTALGRRVGALKKDMFALDAAHDRSDHIVYNSHNGKLFYDADGAGGHAAIQIAQLKAHLHLDYHAFAVV